MSTYNEIRDFFNKSDILPIKDEIISKYQNSKMSDIKLLQITYRNILSLYNKGKLTKDLALKSAYKDIIDYVLPYKNIESKHDEMVCDYLDYKKSNNREKLMKIVSANLGLIVKEMYKHNIGIDDLEEIFNISVLNAIKAVERYYKITYQYTIKGDITRCVRYGIKKFLSEKKIINEHEIMDSEEIGFYVDDEIDCLIDTLFYKDKINEVWNTDILTPKEKVFICMISAIGNSHEIEKLSHSKSYVYEYSKKITKKITKYLNNESLKYEVVPMFLFYQNLEFFTMDESDIKLIKEIIQLGPFASKNFNISDRKWVDLYEIVSYIKKYVPSSMHKINFSSKRFKYK